MAVDCCCLSLLQGQKFCDHTALAVLYPQSIKSCQTHGRAQKLFVETYVSLLFPPLPFLTTRSPSLMEPNSSSLPLYTTDTSRAVFWPSSLYAGAPTQTSPASYHSFLFKSLYLRSLLYPTSSKAGEPMAQPFPNPQAC